jgi:Peptidase M50B-like
MSWSDALDPSTWSTDEVALVAGLLLALACLARPLWPAARLLVTAVHELGHVSAALLLGGKVRRVHLWRDTAGLTTYALPAGTGRLRGLVVLLSGYPAPGLAGLLGASLVAGGWSRWWVGLAAAVTAVMLVLWVRNAWGITLSIVVAGVLGWVAWAGWPWLVTAVGAAMTGLLLVGGWRAAATHAAGREQGGRAGSDAALATRLLAAPAPLWSWLFLLAASATLLAGGWLLAGAVTG